ncbi:L-lysine 6-transaminase [candidate division KSB1 bacterium]
MQNIPPSEVRKILGEHMLTDGYDIVLDLNKSQGAYLHDSQAGKKYLDFFTFFASNPIGMNHPKMLTAQFMDRIARTAVNKPSNSDVYTEELASCVKTFSRVAIPDYLPHLFFVSGGALAVENCMKAAFDWKVRKNFENGIKDEKGHQIIHFRNAFHGRSGYTLSVTNTDPAKTDYFTKFNWPRIPEPYLTFPLTDQAIRDAEKREKESIDMIHKAIKDNPDDIAAILIEPIQGEGGDNFFRKEFFQALRTICDESEIMLIFDEVQTGMGLTGKMWCHQHYDVKPDLMAFGKKTQVCGILGSQRLDEVTDNVFHVSSRINSTFGGNLVDMVRLEKFLEIIEEENLVENARIKGEYLLAGLSNLEQQFNDKISNVRGLGLFCAFDMPSTDMRNTVVSNAWNNGMIVLGCGTKSIRCRPRLNVTEDEIDEAMKIFYLSLKDV